ncbi:MAG TPA: hypothetical protein VE964_05780 [Myxococcales bacterium]|nr:hypothetical protein [Myxococcales bacterium]
MIRRATKTCYFLNRRARYLALIARDARLPAAIGVWIPIANPDRAPWDTLLLLSATYRYLDARGLRFAVLTDDLEIEEFEEELRQRSLHR